MEYDNLMYNHSILLDKYNKLRYDMDELKTAIDKLGYSIHLGYSSIPDKIINDKWEYSPPYITSYNGTRILFCPNPTLSQSIIDDHNISLLVK